MRAIALISGVIYIALMITATIIAYNAFLPSIKKLQEAGIAQQVEKAMAEIDGKISAVAGEASGSRRLVPLDMKAGRLVINGSQDAVYWEMPATAMIASPRTAKKTGNVLFGSQLDTKAYESRYNGVPAYAMENEHLLVYIRKIGGRERYSPIDTGGIILNIMQKDMSKWLDGEVSIRVDDKDSNGRGMGYTALEETGNNLPYATAIAFVASVEGSYTVSFILESGADFLQIKVE